MAKPAPKTRAPRRSAEQIARDDLAMTQHLLDKATARYQRLCGEIDRVQAERLSLQTMRDYQSAHPLLAQEPLNLEPEA